jgi:hypothetical protein
MFVFHFRDKWFIIYQMVDINSLVIVDEEGKASDPQTASFAFGITHLAYEKKSVFSSLLLSFSEIKSGSIAVGQLVLAGNNDNKIQIFELEVSVSGIASLTAVFFTDKINKEFFALQKTVSSSFKTAKGMAVATEEDRKAKLSYVLDVLLQNGLSYLLIDLNEGINSSDETLIESVLFLKKGVFVFLQRNPVAEVASTRAQTRFSTLVFPNKAITLYRSGLLLLSFLAAFSLLLGSIQTKAGSSWGALVLIVGVLLLLGDLALAVYSLTTRPFGQRTRDRLLGFEFINMVFNVLGVAFGLAVVYLMAKESILVTASPLEGLPLAVLSLTGLLLAFVPFVAQPFCFSLLPKITPKKNNNE